MTTPDLHTSTEDAPLLHCGCCGRSMPAGRLAELGTTPGVHNTLLLLGLKTKAGYTHRPVSGQERLQAGRRAHALVDSARGLRLP